MRLSISCSTCIFTGEKLPEVRFDATPFGYSCPAGWLQANAGGSAQLEQMSLLQNLRGVGSASLRQVKLLALEKEA